MPTVVLKSLSCLQHSKLTLLLQLHLFPLLLKTLSSRSAFPLSLRGTRVAFLLLKQFPSELETEAKPSSHYSSNLLLARLTRGEPRPGWMRVLAMEIMLG
jgi:Guanine nucleotide exchange factor in Golgi transport N-terminal